MCQLPGGTWFVKRDEPPAHRLGITDRRGQPFSPCVSQPPLRFKECSQPDRLSSFREEGDQEHGVTPHGNLTLFPALPEMGQARFCRGSGSLLSWAGHQEIAPRAHRIAFKSPGICSLRCGPEVDDRTEVPSPPELARRLPGRPRPLVKGASCPL